MQRLARAPHDTFISRNTTGVEPARQKPFPYSISASLHFLDEPNSRVWYRSDRQCRKSNVRLFVHPMVPHTSHHRAVDQCNLWPKPGKRCSCSITTVPTVPTKQNIKFPVNTVQLHAHLALLPLEILKLVEVIASRISDGRHHRRSPTRARVRWDGEAHIRAVATSYGRQ